MPLLDRKTHRLYYEVSGGGLPVLLTHAYSASHAMWRGQADALEQDCKVLIWDMHGHGATESSDDPADYSEQHTVEDMAALMDACGMEKAVIGGLSLGGYMTLAFYLRYPERVSALMLFDTGPGFKKDEAREEWNATAVRTAENLEREGVAAPVGISAEVQLAAHHQSTKALALAARGMLSQKDGRVINSLSDVDVPALVLAGAEDQPFLAATDYMASKIPQATKVVIEGAGHAANIDQPQAFNAAVGRFLSAL